MKPEKLKFKYYRKGVIYIGNHYDRIKLDPSEMKKLINVYHALYLRNIYDFDVREETNYWHIIQDKFYEIDDLTSKSTRKNLRKSLSSYRYSLVSKEEILSCGYNIFCEAAIRFNIAPSWTQKDFFDYVEEVFQSDGDFWIGYDIETGEPAMWESILKFDDHVIMDVERLSYRFTKGNPTYGLNYKILEYYLKEKGFKYVDAGAMSLSQHSNVQDFLVDKLQFRKAYCRTQFYLRPWLRFCLSILKPISPLFKSSSSNRIAQLLQMYSKI